MFCSTSLDTVEIGKRQRFLLQHAKCLSFQICNGNENVLERWILIPDLVFQLVFMLLVQIKQLCLTGNLCLQKGKFLVAILLGDSDVLAALGLIYGPLPGRQ